jgi:hypothetical protein
MSKDKCRVHISASYLEREKSLRVSDSCDVIQTPSCLPIRNSGTKIPLLVVDRFLTLNTVLLQMVNDFKITSTSKQTIQVRTN